MLNFLYYKIVVVEVIKKIRCINILILQKRTGWKFLREIY